MTLVLLKRVFKSSIFRPYGVNSFRIKTFRKRHGQNQQVLPCRLFFEVPSFGGSSTKEYSETKILGYSMEQFYDVVANVDDYKFFVPWCVASNTFQKSDTYCRANLEVGFPPLSEKYTSLLTLARPNYVKSECMDGTLFNHLLCVWKFSNGPTEVKNSCNLNFYVSFEFKSILHSQLSSLFFDEVVRKMVAAFENRCETLYGPSSLINTQYDSNRRIQYLKTRRKSLIPSSNSKKFKNDGS